MSAARIGPDGSARPTGALWIAPAAPDGLALPACAPRAARTEPGHFERKYRAQADPWGYESQPYEQEKYARTLAAIGPGGFPRALELGCSIGVFTALLAPRCSSLLALDGAPTALERARTRLSDSPHVQFDCRTLPEELPSGRFDLIVASELLYYWDAALLAQTLPRMEQLLMPGGRFVAVHWRGEVADGPLDGDGVHALLREQTTLRHIRSQDTDAYRLDCWERPAGPAGPVAEER